MMHIYLQYLIMTLDLLHPLMSLAGERNDLIGGTQRTNTYVRSKSLCSSCLRYVRMNGLVASWDKIQSEILMMHDDIDQSFKIGFTS